MPPHLPPNAENSSAKGRLFMSEKIVDGWENVNNHSQKEKQQHRMTRRGFSILGPMFSTLNGSLTSTGSSGGRWSATRALKIASTVRKSSLCILEAHTSRPVCTLECSILQVNRRCTSSSSRRYDPVAIWAHLDPVLMVVREDILKSACFIFFSHGPARLDWRKGNFFYLSMQQSLKGTLWWFWSSC